MKTNNQYKIIICARCGNTAESITNFCSSCCLTNKKMKQPSLSDKILVGFSIIVGITYVAVSIMQTIKIL